MWPGDDMATQPQSPDSTKAGELRRYSGDGTTRVAAGGGYDEWFELKTVRPSVAQVLTIQSLTSSGERLTAAIAFVIKSWSLVDAAGASLPISAAVVDTLPYDMLMPVIEHVNGGGFLG